MRPAICPDPGGIIADELEARGWSYYDLAKKMDMAPVSVYKLCRNEWRISQEIAVKLSLAFGTSWQLWVNLQNHRDKWLEEEEWLQRGIRITNAGGKRDR
jgi:HTH-type transcriptional regulator/antitoxin HigA